jgi:hypothetical protein
MRLVKLTVAFAIAIHLLFPESSAHADGVLLVTGAASPHQREIIGDAFQTTARSLHWKLSTPSLARELIDAAVKCLADSAPWACVAPELRRSEQIIIVQLENERGASVPTTIATAHVLIAGIQSDVSASRYTETGDEQAFKRNTAELSKVLQDAAERTGRTTLLIRSKPDKAWITLDGQNIGATEKTRATYPGTHTLSLRRIGYKATTREVVAVEGKVTTEDFALEPDGPSNGRTDGPSNDRGNGEHPVGSSSRLLPKFAVFAGGAAVGAGVFWLVYNQKPDPHGHQDPYYHHTSAYGYVSLAAGALTAGVGLYFWLRSDATSAAAVTPLRGGAAASWLWRF